MYSSRVPPDQREGHPPKCEGAVQETTQHNCGSGATWALTQITQAMAQSTKNEAHSQDLTHRRDGQFSVEQDLADKLVPDRVSRHLPQSVGRRRRAGTALRTERERGRERTSCTPEVMPTQHIAGLPGRLGLHQQLGAEQGDKARPWLREWKRREYTDGN